MWKKTAVITAAAILLGAFNASGDCSVVHASTTQQQIDKTKDEMNKLEDQLDQTQSSIDKLENNSSKLQKELNRLNSQLMEVTENLANLEQQIGRRRWTGRRKPRGSSTHP